MRKVLFLMFLLLLMVLGAAGVKAQVRIGGNTPPNPAAVLDLNTTDDATPAITKGALALPRVNLTSNTMQLISGVPNLTGTLVYNTNATLVAGVYSWTGSTWKRVDAVPATSAADSAYLLMSTPQGPIWSGGAITTTPNSIPSSAVGSLGTVTWTKICEVTFDVTLRARTQTGIPVTGLMPTDYCYTVISGLGGDVPFVVWTWYDKIEIVNADFRTNHSTGGIRCYRPSI